MFLSNISIYLYKIFVHIARDADLLVVIMWGDVPGVVYVVNKVLR